MEDKVFYAIGLVLLWLNGAGAGALFLLVWSRHRERAEERDAA